MAANLTDAMPMEQVVRDDIVRLTAESFMIENATNKVNMNSRTTNNPVPADVPLIERGTHVAFISLGQCSRDEVVFISGPLVSCLSLSQVGSETRGESVGSVQCHRST